MKKILILLTLIFAINASFSLNNLAITEVSVSDASIYPGESGVISFLIQNLGSDELSNIKVYISSGLEIENKLINIGSMKAGTSNFIVTSYFAQPNASKGSYPININVKYDYFGQQLTSQSGSAVNVLGINELVIENYTTSLLIDNLSTFKFLVSNQGSNPLNNIFIKIIMPNGFIAETGSEFYIDSINPGEYKEFTSRIFIQKDIEPKAYQFILSANANSYSKNATLNILVKGEPKLVINSINLDPKIMVAGSNQIISTQIENIGSSKAYGVKAELLTNESLAGITFELLGSLDREDITSAIFEIITPNSEKLEGSVKITYYDSQNNEFYTVQEINYSIIPSSGSETYLWNVLILIAIIAFFLYKKSKKKK